PASPGGCPAVFRPMNPHSSCQGSTSMNPHSPVSRDQGDLMNRLLRTRAARGATVAALAGLVAAFTIAAAPAASADTVVKVKYPVHGSTFLKAPNATINLGPG